VLRCRGLRSQTLGQLQAPVRRPVTAAAVSHTCQQGLQQLEDTALLFPNGAHTNTHCCRDFKSSMGLPQVLPQRVDTCVRVVATGSSKAGAGVAEAAAADTTTTGVVTGGCYMKCSTS
jgi:hypothetical protein